MKKSNNLDHLIGCKVEDGLTKQVGVVISATTDSEYLKMQLPDGRKILCCGYRLIREREQCPER